MVKSSGKRNCEEGEQMTIGALREAIKTADRLKRKAGSEPDWVALDTAVFCMKKYIPKSVLYNEYGAILCPSCREVVENDKWRHCPWCGRRIKIES